MHFVRKSGLIFSCAIFLFLTIFARAETNPKTPELDFAAWQSALQVEIPKVILPQSIYLLSGTNFIAEKLFISRNGKGEHIPILFFSPLERARAMTVVLAHPNGKSAFLDSQKQPTGLAKDLLAKNISVLLLDVFSTDESVEGKNPNSRFDRRSVLEKQVQDSITAAMFAKQKRRNAQVILCGANRAGLWSLLAAPAMDGVVADCSQLEIPHSELPDIENIGGLKSIVGLAAPNPILLHNCDSKIPTNWLESAYPGARKKLFKMSASELTARQIAEWIAQLK